MITILEANSTAILTGGLYNCVLDYCVREISTTVEEYVEKHIGKSYSFLYNDFMDGGYWYSSNIGDNYRKLFNLLSEVSNNTIAYYESASVASSIEKYLRPKSNKGDIKVFTRDDTSANGAYHTWHTKDQISKIFINEKTYSVYASKLCVTNYLRSFLIIMGDNDKFKLNPLDNISKNKSKIISKNKVNDLVRVTIHEFTHNEQQIYIPDENAQTKLWGMANTKIAKNVETYASGSGEVQTDTNQYAYHFMSNIEHHAIAEDSLAAVLLKNIDFLDEEGIYKFKKSINHNPSTLVSMVIAHFTKLELNIDYDTKKPYSANSKGPGGLAQKNIIKFISKVVNNWWYDSSDLLKSDIEQQFANHQRGADKRKEKNSTRDYRMLNGTVPFKDISKIPKSEYVTLYNEYIPNIIKVTENDIDLSYLNNPASVSTRQNVICHIISSLYTKELGVPVNVANDIQTKFSLPKISLDTRKYIDEFNSIPIGIYDTIGNALSILSPIDIFMRELEETPSIILESFIDNIVQLIREKNETLPPVYFRKLIRIVSETSRVTTRRKVRELNQSFSDDGYATITEYLTYVYCNFAKFIMENEEIINSSISQDYDLKPIIVGVGDSALSGVIIDRELVGKLVVNDYTKGRLKSAYDESIGTVSYKKAYTSLKNNKKVLVPIIQKIVDDIENTYTPKIIKLQLTTQELKGLKKALADVKLASLSKKKDIGELQKALGGLLPVYKDMILSSKFIPEKSRNIIKQFMS